MFIENRHGRNCLNSIVKENKHQAPKTDNVDNSIVNPP